MDTSVVESYEWTLKHCRVDKEYCRVEKCISLGRLRRFKHDVVSEGPKQQVVESYEWTQVLSSRTSGYKCCRVVRVDTSIVESRKNIVEWKNAYH